uniref:Uncharacterized protein n=1 Tax=Panagrellus redivivus TaxID=6233 RepID=A0A7E4ULX9_PANRE
MGSFLDDVLCGCLTVGFAGIFLAFYVVILLVLKIRHDKFNAPIYEQMFNMGITDCIQLFLHVLGGVCSLAQFDIPPDVNKVVEKLVLVLI